MKKFVRRDHLKTLVKIVLGGSLSFAALYLTSHPKSPLNKKIPTKKIKNIHFAPSLKIHHKNKVFHFHHWLVFSVIYIPLLLMRNKILRSKILHGAFLGSILQGLIYKDRFNILYDFDEEY